MEGGTGVSADGGMDGKVTKKRNQNKNTLLTISHSLILMSKTQLAFISKRGHCVIGEEWGRNRPLSGQFTFEVMVM